MGKLKVAVIGCGGIANQKHFPALKNNADLNEIVAFCDIKIERAQEAAEKMVEAWKKSGMQFTVGYQNRFRPEVQNLHAACQKGDLGDIYYAKAHAVRRRGVPTWGVFMDKEAQGGGPLIDIGTHALDITLWCMNNYKPVSVMGSVFEKLGHSELATQGNMFGAWDPETYEVEDSAFGFIKFENGATIFLESSWAINMKDSREAACTLCGTKAGAEIVGAMSGGGASNGREYDLIVNGTYHGQLVEQKLSEGGTIAFFEGGSSEPKDLECEQWLNCIINDTEPVVKPEQAFVVTQILDAIYESARTGKEVILNK